MNAPLGRFCDIYCVTCYQFKVDRLQSILVAKTYIYLYVSQLFISRMPKMRAIPVTFCEAVVLKVMDHKTLVKRR